jgi:sigma-E factor negative regulatory protein RseB
MALGVAAAHAADNEDPATVWLEKMSRSSMTYNYKGTFIYRRGNELVAMNIVHVADERGGRQRLSALNGAPREIIRSCDSAVCFLPHHKAVIVNKQRHKAFSVANISKRIATLQEHYRVSVEGTDRVAGRKAQMLSIEPADHYRYGYRVWIDSETGLLLKSDMRGDDGKSVEQIMFTNLTLVENPTPDMLEAVDNEEVMRNRKSENNLASFDDTSDEADETWQVEDIPEGFKRVEHYQHRASDHGELIEHMIFTDGLASVSVFIEKTPPGEAMLSGVSTMGGVNAYGAVVADHHVTVVGEVPTQTVREIGDSVHYIPDNDH